MKIKLIIFPVIISLLFLISCQKSSPEQTSLNPIPIKVRQVEEEIASRLIRLTGTIMPYEKAGLSFKVPGRIESIHVDDGDRVEKGELLAELETGDYELGVKMAQAQVKALEPEFDRQKTLLADGAITQANFEKFEAQYKVATYQLDLARRRLDDCLMFAPFKGEIALKKADQGELTAPERMVLLLINMDQAEAEIGVSDIDVHYFELGKKVVLTINAIQDEILSGKVVHIGSMPDPISRTYKVRIRLPNEKGLLKAGMIVTINICLKDCDEAFIGVPLSAVLHSPEIGPYVFVIEGDKAIPQDIELGRMMAREIEVLQGLYGGELLVVRGQHYLKKGSMVRVIP
jgi:membrane fusion protein (multidrug efflux system)